MNTITAIEKFRARLMARHGQWMKLEADSGISRRTIYRIAHGLSLPNTRTMLALDGAMARKRQTEPA